MVVRKGAMPRVVNRGTAGSDLKVQGLLAALPCRLEQSQLAVVYSVNVGSEDKHCVSMVKALANACSHCGAARGGMLGYPILTISYRTESRRVRVMSSSATAGTEATMKRS